MAREQPTETHGLADVIAGAIKHGIMSGEIPAGARLHQAELCKRFAVSRTPIREALRKLQAQNFVEFAPNRGTRVRVPTRAEVEELYRVRAELEGFAAELAARNVSSAQITRLRESVEDARRESQKLADGSEMCDTVDKMNDSLKRAASQFHTTIYEATANAVLTEVLRGLSDRFPRDEIWRALRSQTGTAPLETDDHEKVIEALEAGQGRLARRAMSRHMVRAGQLLVNHLIHEGFWNADATRLRLSHWFPSQGDGAADGAAVVATTDGLAEPG